MAYTGQQRFLIRDAQKYLDLGYRVGLCKGKSFLQEYKLEVTMTFRGPISTSSEVNIDFDGISIIPHEIVCVDIDITDFGVVYEDLPITWKERSPRGWHLWYRLPLVLGTPWSPKIKWREHVDLLVKQSPTSTFITSAGNMFTSFPLKGFTRKTVYGSKQEDDDEEDEPLPNWGEHVLCSGTTGYTRVWPDEVPTRDNLTLAPQWLQDALLK